MHFPLASARPSRVGSVAGFGAATIIFGLSTNLWLSLAMLFLTGLFGDSLRVEENSGWMMMIVGGSLSVVSLIIKSSFERTADHMRNRPEVGEGEAPPPLFPGAVT